MSFELANLPALSVLLTSLLTEEGAYALGLASYQMTRITGLEFVVFYTAGVLLGDIALYSFGLLARRSSLMSGWSWLQQRVASANSRSGQVSAAHRLDEYLVLTRCVPGTRIPTYLYCGFSRYPLWRFVVILGASGALYSALGLLLISLAASQFDMSHFKWYHQVALAVVISLMVIKFTKGLSKLYGYKKHYGRAVLPLKVDLERRFDSEFWSSLSFYLPFVPYFVLLLFRYRGFHRVLRSNPAIAHSGVFGERKSDIQKLIETHVLEYQLKLIEVPSEPELAKKTLSENFTFPFVLKPNSGLKGAGVRLIKTAEQLEQVDWSTDWVAQQYCQWPHEWGVFYVRDLDSSAGGVFSVTNKVLPKVTGDGKQTLFELILNDSVLRPRLHSLLGEESGLKPNHVPEAGELVHLSYRGSHSQGCLFLDGAELLSKEIETHIARVFDRIPGFNVGRADIKFESLEALSRGEFRIVEINGAGAESTNLYDPKYSLWQRYKIVALQWRTIFEIGKKSTMLHKANASLISFFKALWFSA